jgi:hypothetical protein
MAPILVFEISKFCKNKLVMNSVADPDPFYTDPAPAFHFDTETDPTFQFDTDPDPTDAEPDSYCFKEVMYIKQYRYFLYNLT